MPRWTPESRARQAELIHSWAPWSKSTGPSTPAGKAKAARNPDKGKAEREKFRRDTVRLAKSFYRAGCLMQEQGAAEDRQFARMLAKHAQSGDPPHPERAADPAVVGRYIDVMLKRHKDDW